MATVQGGFAEVGVAERVITIGGFTDNFGAPVQTVQSYDSRTRQWTRMAAMPTARGDVAASAVGHRIYAIGGYGPGPARATVEVLDLRTGTWSAGASLPSPRAGAAAVTVGRRIYVIGEYDESDAAVRSVEVYETASGRWSSAASMTVPRGNLRVVRSAGRIYAVGGADTDGVPTSAVEAFDPACGRWRPVTSMRSAREGHGLAADSHGRVYAISGVDGPRPYHRLRRGP
jgi:N-acetylneuraminic acid mutarotase